MSDNGDLLVWLQDDDLACQGFESPNFWRPTFEKPYNTALAKDETQYFENRMIYTDLATLPSNSPHGSASSEQVSKPSLAPEISNGLVQTRRNVYDKKSRRREQNRRAQQVYRARKEKLRESLEDQICEWHAKYDCLLRSYVDLSNEIRKLRSKLKQLKAQPGLLEPQSFDLVPRYIASVCK